MSLRDELIETVIGLPPEGWTLGHVTVRGRDDERVSVEAMRRGAFAVHEVETYGVRAWRLTHAPSGLQIWTLDEIDDVMEFAERIEPFADWEEIKDMVPYGSDLYPKVRAELDKILHHSETA